MSTQLTLRDDAGNSLAERARTPMDLLQLAIEREGSIDVIERLAKLQMEMQDRDDRIRFSEAMARFKDEVPTIIRRRPIKGKDGGELYKAVALEDVADPLAKALLQVGITYRWKTADLPDGRVRVTCFLRLKGTAYEEEGSTLAGPPDTSGGKDALKGIGSSSSYLEKYTLLASCGVHVYGSDPEAVHVEGITNDEGSEWVDKISLCESAIETMAVWTKANESAARFNPPDYKAMTIFHAARDKRLKELKAGAK